MIDNSVDYRGIKVDKQALEFDKEMVDEYIDKLYQPERSKREDMEGPSHTPDKGWTDKNAGFP